MRSREDSLGFADRMRRSSDSFKVLLCVSVFVFWNILIQSYTSDGAVGFLWMSFLAGLLFETFRETKNRFQALKRVLISFWLCLVVVLYLVGESVGYLNWNEISKHSNLFFKAFSWLLVICVLAFERECFTPKLHEGITLIYSLTICFWLVDFAQRSQVGATLLALCLVPTVYIAIHSLVVVKLSDQKKLLLSIWNTTLMLFFSVIYIVNFFKHGTIFNATAPDIEVFWAKLIESFFLGTSGIYIIMNLTLLLGYLPSKSTGLFDRKYFRVVKQLNREHISRYSSIQMKPSYSAGLILAGVSLMALNSQIEFLSREAVVCIFLTLTPLIFDLLGAKPTMEISETDKRAA